LKMVADVYPHIIDDDRCLNAQRFEDEFYGGKKKPEQKEQKPEKQKAVAKAYQTDIDESTMTDAETLELLKLLKKPGVAELLKAMSKAN